MDKIVMKNLGFYGYHGVHSEEKKLGQKFFLDLILYVDLRQAGQTDDVCDTVNYGDVYKRVKSMVEEKQFNLLEALAHHIASDILNEYKKIEEIEVKIRKPEAPVPGVYDYMGVEIRRGRHA